MAITINGTTGIAGVDGSAATPAIQGDNDANTGYFFAADTLGLSTAGTERFRITSNGALGTNSTVRSAYGGLDLCAQGATNLGTLTLGAGGGANGQSRNNNQENQFRIMTPTYADPSKMFTVMYGSSGSGGHEINYGGGTGWAYASNTLRFYTASDQTTATGSERMRIDSGGAVRVGTTTALKSTELLTVYSNNGNGLAIGYGTGTNEQRRLYQHSTGLYFESSTNQAYLSAAGAWTDASDIAIKKDIEDITYGITTVKNLKPRKYKMKSDDEAQIGFIAQEMKEQIPEVVGGKEGSLGVSYGSITAVLTKALQEAITKIETLETKVAALEAA